MSEPAARPSHIPQTTVVNSHTYTVVYDRRYGGYGYYNGDRWYAYDAFTDGYVVGALMSNHSYYYPRQTVYVDSGNGGTTVVSNDGGAIFLGILFGLAVVILIGVILSRD